jgi:polyribonucleotide nucleotidyltransferase
MQGIYQNMDLGDGRVLSFETGRLAKQAGGSVVVRLGDTMVLCAATVSAPREGLGFFPLSVDYREFYAAGGKIPGGFMKREGRPSEKEILSSRLVDRCIRPLFPDGYYNEVQILLNVISSDGENDSDVLSGIGASAALMLTGAPFGGPIGEVRVGRVNGEFILFPTISQLKNSDIDLVVAGSDDAILMVEGEMQEVSEEDMIAAIEFAHGYIQQVCTAQRALFEKVGERDIPEYTLQLLPEGLVDKVDEMMGARIAAHLNQPYNKKDFYGGIKDMSDETVAALLDSTNEEGETVRADATAEGWTLKQIRQAFDDVEKKVMREAILSEGRRIDGRGLTDIRQIWTDVGYLPRVHGSAIFTRGETQVLSSVALGTIKDAQMVDTLFDDKDRRFFLHYNFPPYSTGEVKPQRGTSRREIGHGKLAERALSAMMPDEDGFPYTVRIVSEVLESNGSSSMATVCSGSLALMDAGVPVKKAVAGIAMGLIAEGDRIAILSDILGTEDHLGDMDFKVTGTKDGITACQMDIKIAGLSHETMSKALTQAKEGRLHILGIMESALPQAREDMKPFAPRMTQIEIDSEFIGAVIGPGGKMIQGIQRETGTEINIEEKNGKGIVTIAATEGTAAEAALKIIKGIVTKPVIGEDYDAKVIKMLEIGAIVELLPGKEALLHISEMSYEYVAKAEDVFQVGDVVKVRLIDVLDGGKLRVSHKPFLEKPEGYVERERSPRPPRSDDRRGGGGGGDRRGGGGDRRGGGGGDRRR